MESVLSLRTVPWFFRIPIFTIKTVHISPQYQFVFENLFETVYRTGENDHIVDTICNNLLYQKRNWYVLEEYADYRKLIYKPPPLHEVWITDTEHQQHK